MSLMGGLQSDELHSLMGNIDKLKAHIKTDTN